ncbi:isochorismatase family protein [Paenibacillus piri]|uniref:Isochorismatase family protein n=1 Tax=Paenibacillus piri TaxID=2547395 RepID=A0A4R5KRW5_9BACL|nr:isochorismatase family protein [Paenibacillus piri]TDF98573.1 isochorismatase family protein [Paenibacillus piri]
MKYGFEDHCWKHLMSPEVLQIYKAYERDTFIGSRPALLAIDLYNSAYEGGDKPVIDLQRDFPSSCGEYAWTAIEPTKRLFQAARAIGIPVIYSTADLRMRSRTRLQATHRRSKRPDDRAFEIFAEFQPAADDLIIYKTRASAFYGTPLAAFLNMMDADSLIICGESTSGCVRASAVDAYSAGFHTVVVEECCFDRNMLSHQVNLFDLHHKYADVMHIGEVCDQLGQRLKNKRA